MNRMTEAPAAPSRADLVAEFAGRDAAYYQHQFERIGTRSGLVLTFNATAALLGPIWFGIRALWAWALALVVIETFAVVQMARGLFGDLGAEARARIAQIATTLDFRARQLSSAEAAGDRDRIAEVQVFIAELETEVARQTAAAEAAEASGIWVALAGLALLLVLRLAQGLAANPILERRFSDWLSDRSLPSGVDPRRTVLSVVFTLGVFGVSAVHFATAGGVSALAEFPTDPSLRLGAIAAVEAVIDALKEGGRWFFDGVNAGLGAVLDALELLLVETPWPVIAALIMALTWLAAGPRAAIWAGAFLAYMGFLGFWEKAMTTLALLGTAALISIALGIPLGMYCARRPRVYAVIRPIMDFMQTMPAFVFMIPVIAFFSVGKPAAVVVTMIFGGTPVVRLTVLGLRGVPETIREAAIAYGGSKWYLLTRVDLPLAAPSIRAGINQTIMLSLAMVVVASLIGAKGLGEDVLEALQYASVGQGILAGFAILFCAMILDRVVQGDRR